MNRSKLWVVLLIIAVVLIITLIVVNSNKNKNQTNTTQNQAAVGVVTGKDVTNTKQEDLEISGVSVTSDGNTTNVEAQIANNGGTTYSTVEVSVIFYDKDKNVITTTRGLIENLKSDEKKGFLTTISGDFSKAATYEVKVESAK